MRITVLVENTAGFNSNIKAEDGLSLLIEHSGKKILFDMGLSDLYLRNSAILGLDLTDIDFLVLSHGHDDHTGGLPFFSKAFPDRRVNLIAHPDLFERKLFEDGTSIGSPITLERAKREFQVTLTKASYELAEDIIFIGEVPREYEKPEAIGYHYQDGELKPDFVHDDGSLIFILGKGLVVVTGCAHAGILNIVKYAQKLIDRDVYAVIGGFHLLEVTESRLENIIKNFKEMDIKKIFPGHCTGLEAICRMRRELTVKKINAGAIIDI
jgi:7,8-dihydropterin-6-yl-methyl-4-(beta-D-ribofuranosyl)aminobenzene 5'-phosphate synthase